MTISKDSPPKTIRRKSIRSSVRDTVLSDGPVGSDSNGEPELSEARANEFTNIVQRLRIKLKTALKKAVEALRSKIAGAGDPDYPRSEAIQQIKLFSSSMYTACQYICYDVCDVPDESLIIKYCFGVCMEVLFGAFFKVISPEKELDFLTVMTAEILEEARRNRSSQVSFSALDVESYVVKWVKRWGLEDSGAVRSETPKRQSVVKVPTPQPVKATTLEEQPALAPVPAEPVDLNAHAANLISLLGRIGFDKSILPRATVLTREFVETAQERLGEARRARAASRLSQESQLV